MMPYNTTDGLIAINSNEEVVLWNKAAEQILKIPKKDVIGKSCLDMCHRLGLSDILACHKECSVNAKKKETQLFPNFNWQIETRPNNKVILNWSILHILQCKNEQDPSFLHVFRPFFQTGDIDGFVKQIRSVVLNELGVGIDAKPISKLDQFTSLAKSFPLTQREVEVFGLIVYGATTEEISDQLNISVSTVSTHTQRILKKLQVHSKWEAISLLLRNNLL